MNPLRTTVLRRAGRAAALVLFCAPLAVAAERLDDALQARVDALGAADLQALRAGADSGDVMARLVLGEAYLHGHGVEADATQAWHWFEQAMAGGDPRALYWFGRKHDLGDGTSRDQAAAAGLYRRAADAGLGAAQNRLGELYVRGHGVRQDYREALAWFRRAVQQGHPDALANLASMHYHGRGVERDYGQAFALFHRAAVAGNDGALLVLGNMALHGLGTRRDLVDAYRWYGLATYGSRRNERSAARAETMLEQIGPHLSAEQLDEALADARSWAADHGRERVPNN